MSKAAAVLTLLALPALAFADDPVPARIRLVEGEVTLQRATEASAEPAVPNLIWLAGDRLWTDAGARAELQLPDGSLLHLATASKLDLIGQDEEGAIALRIWAGSLSLWIPAGRERPDVAIETPDSLVYVREAGLYRIDTVAGETRLSVVSGAASLESAGEQLSLVAGQRSWARYGEPPERPEYFDPDPDAFDSWIDERLRNARHSLPGGVPSEVEPWAGELSEYGEWAVVPEVGTVWRPRGVAVDWQPYRYGHWAWSPWGWSWTSTEPWGWAPYHYGRWGFSGSLGWYWSPGRTWGPAWVSWSLGSGYVGWCPLGLRGGPVFPHYRSGRGSRGWLYVDHRGLGSRHLGRHRVGHDRLYGTALTHLDPGRQPDRLGRRAVARGSAPAQLRSSAFGRLDERFGSRSAVRPGVRRSGELGSSRPASRTAGAVERRATTARERGAPVAEPRSGGSRSRARTPARSGLVAPGRDRSPSVRPGAAARGTDLPAARGRTGDRSRPSAAAPRRDVPSRSITRTRGGDDPGLNRQPAARAGDRRRPTTRSRDEASPIRPSASRPQARSGSREPARTRPADTGRTSRPAARPPDAGSRGRDTRPSVRPSARERSRSGSVAPASRSRTTARPAETGRTSRPAARPPDAGSRGGGTRPSVRPSARERSRSGSIAPASRSRTTARPAESPARSRGGARPAAREAGSRDRDGSGSPRERARPRSRERQQQR